MNLRESCLSPGWYHKSPSGIFQFLAEFAGEQPLGSVNAVIAPHAGWYYSGRIAARAMASLHRDIETLAIIGGHLPGNAPPLFAMEDGVNTPLGGMVIDSELRAALHQEIGGQEDRYPDNTIEVLLPMARFFCPDASLLWLRLPANISSFEAGKAIAAAAADLGRNVAVVASTDLTHYGPNYGFTPQGKGADALAWVRDVNDRNFIDAVVSGDPAAVLERAQQDNSSCSAGAVLGVMGFAAATGLGPARLVDYATSADVEESAEAPDSFVGYAAFVFNDQSTTPQHE